MYIAVIRTITAMMHLFFCFLPQGKAKCLPQLAWHHVVIEHRSSGKTYSVVNPVSSALLFMLLCTLGMY